MRVEHDHSNNEIYFKINSNGELLEVEKMLYLDWNLPSDLVDTVGMMSAASSHKLIYTHRPITYIHLAVVVTR